MNDTKKRKRFMPQNRGNLTEAVAENKLSQVAPSSPRSSGMLNVKINGRNLTAADLALYECPSSYKMGHQSILSFGGSGLF